MASLAYGATGAGATPNPANDMDLLRQRLAAMGGGVPSAQPSPVSGGNFGTLSGMGIQPTPITSGTPAPTGSVPGVQPSQPRPVQSSQPTLGNLGIQPRENPVGPGAVYGGGGAPGPVQGPGVDALGLPTVGSAGGINEQLKAALDRMLGFNPQFQGVDPGSGQLGGDFDKARGLLGDSEFSPTFSDDYQRLFSQFTKSLEGGGGIPNYNLPDRVGLAQGALDRYNEAQAPIFQDQLRTVGSKAAALGRIGAGMTTNELTDVVTREGDARRRFGRDVIDDAVKGTAEDEYRKASLGLQGQGLRANSIAQLGGLDLERAGLGQRAREFATGGYMDLGRTGLDEGFRSRGEARTERDTQFNQDLSVQDALARAFGQGGELSDRLFGQERDVRGERRQLSRDAINDRERGILLEDQLAGSDFDRAMRRAELLMQGSDIGGVEGSDVLSQFLR